MSPLNAISLEHLRAIPYLNVDVLGERVVQLMPYWDGERWRSWVPTGDSLIPIAIVDVVQSDYVAEKPASPKDVLIPFVETVWQRASWPEVAPHLSSLIQDLHSLGAVWAKLDVFFRERKRIGDGVWVFASTEIDYLFILVRSIFDLLQEIIHVLWYSRVRFKDADAEARRTSQKLPKVPKEFSRVVLEGETPLSADAISTKYGLPLPLATVYEAIAPFFIPVRRFRDRVVHGIGTRQIVYVTERGFCVDPRGEPFKQFKVWTESARLNQNLYSLLPLVAHVILTTIDSCNGLFQAFSQMFEFPPEIAPKYHVFTRGYFNDAWIRTLEIEKGASPWPGVLTENDQA